MRYSVLLVALLLSACASVQRPANADRDSPAPVQESHNGNTERHSVVEQSPAKSDPVNPPPKRQKHNIEED